MKTYTTHTAAWITAIVAVICTGVLPAASAHAQTSYPPSFGVTQQSGDYYSGYPSYFGVNNQPIYNAQSQNLPADYPPSSSYSQYSPSDYYANYTPSSSYSQYTPSSSYSQYSPSSYYSQYSPASYYSRYSPSSAYSQYSPAAYNSTCGGNGSCNVVVTPTQVIAPAPVGQFIPMRQPYVTLSEAPYTGLDLGPWGTFLYWSFLVLWCLFMAYLIAIKRVHHKIADSLRAFLFGADEDEDEEDSVETMPAHAAKPEGHASAPLTIPTYVASMTKGEDPVDEFVLSQIHKIA